jgi:hypothetical protein
MSSEMVSHETIVHDDQDDSSHALSFTARMQWSCPGCMLVMQLFGTSGERCKLRQLQQLWDSLGITLTASAWRY